MSYFDNDDWQPAEWLEALNRLAPAPALEEIPATGKMLDAATKPVCDWPMPRTVAQQMPPVGLILKWVYGANEWRTVRVCIDENFPIPTIEKMYYMEACDRCEQSYDLTSEIIWLPLPPKPEAVL